MCARMYTFLRRFGRLAAHGERACELVVVEGVVPPEGSDFTYVIAPFIENDRALDASRGPVLLEDGASVECALYLVPSTQVPELRDSCRALRSQFQVGTTIKVFDPPVTTDGLATFMGSGRETTTTEIDNVVYLSADELDLVDRATAAGAESLRPLAESVHAMGAQISTLVTDLSSRMAQLESATASQEGPRRGALRLGDRSRTPQLETASAPSPFAPSRQAGFGMPPGQPDLLAGLQAQVPPPPGRGPRPFQVSPPAPQTLVGGLLASVAGSPQPAAVMDKDAAIVTALQSIVEVTGSMSVALGELGATGDRLSAGVAGLRGSRKAREAFCADPMATYDGVLEAARQEIGFVVLPGDAETMRYYFERRVALRQHKASVEIFVALNAIHRAVEHGEGQLALGRIATLYQALEVWTYAGCPTSRLPDLAWLHTHLPRVDHEAFIATRQVETTTVRPSPLSLGTPALCKVFTDAQKDLNVYKKAWEEEREQSRPPKK